ncbi:MAG: hypothetical protein CSYNP_01941 [Syntrophus sp. SKADARSKE-3]|nr:hypothetical protein [Syntrophus sp. SKADARSKE-3]
MTHDVASDNIENYEQKKQITLSDLLEPLLEDSVNNLVRLHGEGLVLISTNDIIDALWKTGNENDLTEPQKSIRTLQPSILKMVSLLTAEKMTDEQRGALNYIVRGMMLYKTLYIKERMKNKIAAFDLLHNPDVNSLLKLNIAGHG